MTTQIGNKDQPNEAKADVEQAEVVKPEPAKTTAVATQNGAGQTISKLTIDLAQKMVLKYANDLVQNKRAQEFYTNAMLMVRNNPKLAQVDPASFLSAVMACVHLDLMPNTPQQYAYIIPYGKDAQFQLGYKGLAELAYRTGNIVKLDAEVVFKDDLFKVTLGTDRQLVHEPSFEVDRTDYTKVTHAYATAQLKDGTVLFEVVTRKELDKIKNTAKAGGPGTPWAVWPIEMAKKTAVKRMTKLLPASATDNRLQLAAEYDSLAEVGKLRVIDGEVVPETAKLVPEHIRDAIATAKDRGEVEAILADLTVEDRKAAAHLAQARVKELA